MESSHLLKWELSCSSVLVSYPPCQYAEIPHSEPLLEYHGVEKKCHSFQPEFRFLWKQYICAGSRKGSFTWNNLSHVFNFRNAVVFLPFKCLPMRQDPKCCFSYPLVGIMVVGIIVTSVSTTQQFFAPCEVRCMADVRLFLNTLQDLIQNGRTSVKIAVACFIDVLKIFSALQHTSCSKFEIFSCRNVIQKRCKEL